MSDETASQDLFADCADGNHSECLRTFPELRFEFDPPRRTGITLICSCQCHVKQLCPKDGSILDLLANESDGCGYWCPRCETTYEEEDPEIITETEAER